jgi:hypothetical protein
MDVIRHQFSKYENLFWGGRRMERWGWEMGIMVLVYSFITMYRWGKERIKLAYLVHMLYTNIPQVQSHKLTSTQSPFPCLSYTPKPRTTKELDVGT